MRLEDVFPGAQGGAAPDQLAGRFAELVADVRAVGRPILERGLAYCTPEQLLLAPEAVRRAYLEVAHQSRIHAALREWQAQLPAGREASGEKDHDWWPNPYGATPPRVGTFYDSRSFPDTAPGVYIPTRQTIARPGPLEPVERLLWLAFDPLAEPWLPTAEQRHERWREYKADIAARRRNRYAAERAGRGYTY